MVELVFFFEGNFGVDMIKLKQKVRNTLYFHKNDKSPIW